MVYRSTDAGETGREVVRVTHRTRLVDGVRVRVVRDRAYVGGELVEDTRDWYARTGAGTSGTSARTPRRSGTAP